jgi:enoyl-CoA hydratase
MTYEIVQIALENGIAILTISREKALNALNTQTMLELRHFFSEEAPEIEGLKGVIITGAG